VDIANNSSLDGNFITVATISSAITGAPSVVLNTGGNIQTAFAPTAGSMQLGAKTGAGLIALGGTTTGNSVASDSNAKLRLNGSGTWTVLGDAIAYEHWLDSGTWTLIVNGLLKCNNRALHCAGGTLVANGPFQIPSLAVL